MIIGFLKFLGMFVLLFGWPILMVIWHETAHVFAGKALGFVPKLVRFGQGRLLFSAEWLGVKVEFYSLPFYGMMFAGRTPWRGLRWRGALYALSGLMAYWILTVTLAVVFFFLVCEMRNSGWPFSYGVLEVSQSWVGMVLGISLALMLGNSVPMTYGSREREVSNDGRLLINYLLGKYTRRFNVLLDNLVEEVKLYDGTYRRDQAWIFEADQKTLTLWDDAQRDFYEMRFTEGAEKFANLLGSQKMQPAERVSMLDQLASIPIFHENVGDLDRALACAREAHQLYPHVATLTGTLGSLLVEKGEYREGIVLLIPVTAPENAMADRCISACFLAKAWYHLNHHHLATQWLNFAREGGGAPNLCERMERLLMSKPM